ncbi:hypothetical protein PCI56_26135 [Plesiomonas shigelloides subsp. oncorhynchi]|nr:hypothetical protein [Plesiomonas shigelloides]
MVAALALVAMFIPISVLRRNLSEVLLVAPRSPLSAHLDETLSRIANRHGFIEYSSHLAKIGRRYEVEVNILVPRDGDWGSTVRIISAKSCGMSWVTSWAMTLGCHSVLPVNHAGYNRTPIKTADRCVGGYL